MRDDLRVVIERIRAAPGTAPGRVVVAATMAATVATFLVMGLAVSALRSEQPYLQMIRVSLQPTPSSASGTYLDVDVAVNNAGTATAKGCYAKAYNHLLFSEEIDKSTELGRSEQFDLSPHGGHVPSVRVYPAGLSGEALLGGGVRGPVLFQVECENGESPEEGMTVKVSGPAPGSVTT